MASPAARLPFSGGWIGFFSYEAGLRIEGIDPAAEAAIIPLLRFALYDAAALFDHHTREWHLVAVEWPNGHLSDRPSITTRLAALRGLLQSAQRLDESQSTANDGVDHDTRSDSPETFAAPNMTLGEYLTKVRQAKRYIQRGDIYQVNLTQRFTTRTTLTPVELFARLRQTNPATHGALLIWDEAAVISASPELFLTLRGHNVVTRPIKGTRPRGADADEDNANRVALLASEKDRAELNMIVDLMRNLSGLARAAYKASCTTKGYPRADVPDELHQALARPRIRKVLRAEGIEVDA